MDQDPFKQRQEITKLDFVLGKPEDWNRYKKIRLEALRKDPQAFGSSSQEEEEMLDAEWKDILEMDDRFFIFGERGQEFVALAGARRIPIQNRNIWRIFSVYVNKEYRGGNGEILMRAVLDKLSSVKCSKVTLNVVKDPKQATALALYKRLGFKIVSEQIEEGVDYYEMALYLNNGQEKLSPEVGFAKPEDAGMLKKIRDEAIQGEDSEVLLGFPKDHPFAKEIIAKELAKTVDVWREDIVDNPKAIIVVTKRGDEIIGLARAQDTKKLGWQMAQAYVEKYSRGQGLGRKMLALRLREAIARGGQNAFCTVLAGNDASVANVKSLGFQEAGIDSLDTEQKFKDLMKESGNIPFVLDLTKEEVIKRIAEVLDKK